MKNKILILYFLTIFLFAYVNSLQAKDIRFGCDGKIESQVWQLWEANVRDYIKYKILQERFFKQGDVEALYYFQVYTSNAVSMANRCNNKDRLMEIATLIRSTYGALTPGTLSDSGRRWIHNKGKLKGQEVMLYSLQFLGLASTVANSLATSGMSLNNEEKLFIRDTVQIAIEHLIRWGNDGEIKKLQKVAAAKPEDVQTSSSGLFFTDKQLWMITVYAEIAGIMQANDRQKLGLRELSSENKSRLQKHLNALLKSFAARVSIRKIQNSRIGKVDLADLDRGYRRLYTDNRYAGYEKNIKPVENIPSSKDPQEFEVKINVPIEKVPIRQDTGWDISHARRLVTALDALERNRSAIENIWHLSQSTMTPKYLAGSFANTLVAIIWNGDLQNPLFSNYWSGANGWYRVGYDERGSGKPAEGVPPYGLTKSLPTGGYITWAKYNPVIAIIGKRLYELINSTDKTSIQFIANYYEDFSKTASVQTNNLSKFMFYPSLVGVVNE